MAFKSIQTKTFIILLALTLSMAVLLVLSVSVGFDRSFSRYKQSLYDDINQNLVKQLQAYYQQHGDWRAFKTDRSLWQTLLINSMMDEKAESPQIHRHQRRWKMFKYHALLSVNKNVISGRKIIPKQPIKLLPIQVDHQLVAYLRIPDRKTIHDHFDRQFNQAIHKWLMMMFGAALVFTLMLSWPISGYFTRPIKRLNDHVKKMSNGEYGELIDINRSDELGRLGHNINHLSQTLQGNRENQKTFFTDISHELRTPVSVLRAQIEALQDGIQKPDNEQLNQLHQQVMNLSLLINDIQDLAGTELGSMQYQKQRINLSELLISVLDSFSSQIRAADLSLKQDIEDNSWVVGDALRLQQLLNNILNNSLRYTDAGGLISVSLKTHKQHATVIIEDSAPGVDQRYHNRIFERLFRPDADRNKRQGGFGIGLAIAKNIVTAHQGTIEAGNSSFGGLTIIINLPIDETSHE
ncbi:MAG: ATP-binding protein [Marinicella pacifica]